MKNLFATLLFISFAINSYAQVQATTLDGKQVILYSNGTYKYTGKTVTTASQDCQTYKTGKVVIVNGSNSKVRGSILAKMYFGGQLGAGPVFDQSKDFTLLPGETVTIGDIVEGNLIYSADTEVPDPYTMGNFTWVYQDKQGTKYVTRCETLTITLQ